MERDLIDLLVADHRRIEGLLAEIETATDPDRRRLTIDQVLTELGRHSTAETAYLFPVLRESLPAGPDLVAYEHREHTETGELMTRLTGLDDADPEFGKLLATVLVALRHHIQEEETEVFPRLRSACDGTVLLDLGDRLAADR